MRSGRLLAVLSCAPLVFGVAAAQPDARRVAAFDLSGGTTGVSGHAQVGLHPRLALRLGYNWLDYSRDDEEISGVSYSGDLEVSGFGGYADLHPFANAFVVSGGVMVGDKTVRLDAVPLEPVTLGDQTFDPETVGSLSGTADFDDTSYFAGIGYDPALYKDGRLSLIVRAGVMFAGEPDVVLDAARLQDGSLPAPLEAELRAAIAEEEVILERDIDDYAYWPVLTVGLGFSF